MHNIMAVHRILLKVASPSLLLGLLVAATTRDMRAWCRCLHACASPVRAQLTEAGLDASSLQGRALLEMLGCSNPSGGAPDTAQVGWGT